MRLRQQGLTRKPACPPGHDPPGMAFPDWPYFARNLHHRGISNNTRIKRLRSFGKHPARGSPLSYSKAFFKIPAAGEDKPFLPRYSSPSQLPKGCRIRIDIVIAMSLLLAFRLSAQADLWAKKQ